MGEYSAFWNRRMGCNQHTQGSLTKPKLTEYMFVTINGLGIPRKPLF